MALNISKFLNQFFMEAAEKLSAIQNHMVELENNPRDKDAVLAIQRDMHTIKGSSRMVGLKEISEIAHLLEEAFLQLHEDRVTITGKVMTILYGGVDAMAERLRLAEKKEPLPDASKLLADIQLVIDGKVAAEGKEEDKEKAAEAPSKKFKLDFNVLKEKFKGKIPVLEKTSEKKETIPEPETKKPPEPVPHEHVEQEPAPTPTPSLTEKAYLKVDGSRVETIINEVTDLLSRRYFFTNVIRTTKEFLQLTRGLRKEWQMLKTSDTAASIWHNAEAVANIDNTLNLFMRKLQEFERDYQVNQTNFEGALRDVYDNLLDLKLTPLSSIFNIYPRFVRDYAYRTGKKIRIYVRGGDTHLDRMVIERINEPLIHLIRNACDHGIESPGEREKKGKELTGTIIIEAGKKGNHVEITVTDDGRGLDKDKIVEKAVQKKMVDAQTAQQLEEQEIYAFIFQPGFSTAEQVSDISGRGIGMDVVKKVTRQFGGNFNVHSTKDKGVTFRLEFPVSVFTSKVTYIKEEGRIYAVPGNLIRRIVKLKPDDIKEKTNYSVVVYNDEIYTVAKLNQVLTGHTAGIGTKSLFMMLPKVTERKIGIIVDEILYESEVIIKDPGRFLGKCKYVHGMVIGERGELHIVLDIHDIVNSSAFSKKIKIIALAPQVKKEKPRILVVDDSLLVREMEKNLLEGAGYEVVLGINGLDGYNKALTHRFDLVLADIEMPEMDGFEMIENIKKIEEYADVPTIVLSSVEREEDKIRGIHLGVNAWLQKQDFNDKEILSVIKRFIG